jgi:hypothetical protein
MTVSQRVFHLAGWLLFARPWQTADYTTLQTLLTSSGDTIVTNMRYVADTSANRDIIRHIIGIEVWAQQRLNSLIRGDAYSAEYDQLEPVQTLTLTELTDCMASTRAQSIAVINQLQHAGVALTQTVPHNQFGGSSVVAWTRYMVSHAMIEHKKLTK